MKKEKYQEQEHKKDHGRIAVCRSTKDSSMLLVCVICQQGFALNVGWPVGFSDDFDTPLTRVTLK